MELYHRVADPDTKFSFRKDALVAPMIELIITNSSRISVRRLKFYNCIIMDGTMDENGMDQDGTDRADIQLSMAFEHYQRDFDNI